MRDMLETRRRIIFTRLLNMNMQSAKTTRTVGVVLVNWNGAELTIPCIESLYAGTVKPDRIVVVDNASRDHSVALIADRFPDLELIRNQENAGFTGANNIGISRLMSSGCDYIWILNNDTTIDENCLSTLKSYMDIHPDVSACSGKILYAETDRLIWYAGATYSTWTFQSRHRGEGEEDAGQYDMIEDVPFISGCCMFVRRAAIERIGLFDNHFFAYGEDSDWCIRAQKEKLRLHYLPQAVIRHHLSATVNKLKNQKTRGTTSPFSIYITSRNRLYLIRKHSTNVLQTCIASLAVVAGLAYHAAGLLALGRFEKIGALVMAVYDGITAPLGAAGNHTFMPRYLR
ncbi:glycosyltransferase family 2 protein [Geobacter sp. AOG1]|uniref:glycosyltransferase family 2 protein n=1 Tax=Geobacter sp. AOG1 TaxID=1566346 RepID=UPI001CC3D582|nr:glycosyltransferase family 2 protein [Geobacter sp. AOG1]GFE58592.1 hypothetical protein AOG1_24720 [Geobacter sp. AOG1]